MKNCKILFITTISLFLLCLLPVQKSILAQEYSPMLRSILEFGDVSVKTVNKTDSKLQIEYSIKSMNLIDAKINICEPIFNKSLKSNSIKASKSTLLKNGIARRIIDVDLNNIKSETMVSISIETPDAPAGYQRNYYKYFTLRKTDTGFEIFDPLNPKERKPKESSKDFKIISPNTRMTTLTIQNYSVNISGKILIDYPDPAVTKKGLYGNGVSLWFRNTNNPTVWYHPVLGNVRHTHYDLLDEQGNYSFNFSFSGDLSGYNQAVVLVGRSNSAAIMPVPANGYIIWSDNGYSNYFNESEGAVISINSSTTNISVNQNGIVNQGDGQIFRYMMLARELSIQRYGGSCPYNIPAISARKVVPYDDNNVEVGGVFRIEFDFGSLSWMHYIEINPSSTDFSTVSHEYGHYINYCMWSRAEYSDAERDFKEAWAVFYSFATRCYANKVYGDDLRYWDDNPETGAFTIPTRYNNMRYAYHGKPEIAARACYIWNLYDGYDNDNFKAAEFGGGDNDDMSGYSTRVFDSARNLSSKTFINFHTCFRNGLNPDVQTSVDNIFTFTLTDLYNVPSAKMNSAQVKNLGVNITSPSQVVFSWTPDSYSSQNYYQNRENGYKIYSNNGGGWNLAATVSAGQTSYTYSSYSSTQSYKITAYNTTGESNTPLVFNPLSISISGPTSLALNTNGTWTAISSGGTAPYSYNWEIMRLSNATRAFPSNIWYSVGSNQNTFTTSITAADQRNIKVRCTVIDAQQTSAISNEIQVTLMNEQSLILAGNNDESKNEIPKEYSLVNYPNPFNPTTVITYSLPEAGMVSLKVYNTLGQVVADLVNENKSVGIHKVSFNARNLTSGIYICQIQVNKFSMSKKLLLVK